MNLRIVPSILAADFVNMEEALQSISTADAVHVDVMDYHFVPNLTFGPQMVGRIQEVSPVPLDVHLQVEHPERWVADIAATGADCVTFHVEATNDPGAVIEALEQAGTHTGISISPGTSIEPYLELVERVDQVLIMTVEPGFGGQSFMEEVLGKVTAVSKRVAQSGRNVWIQVDGGIGPDTIQAAARAGANSFVAGSGVFGREISPAQAIAELRAKAQAA